MKKLFFTIAIAAILAMPANALSSQADALNIDGLKDSVSANTGGVLDDFQIDAGLNLEDGLSAIVEYGTEEFSGIFKKAIRSGALILVIAAIMGLADTLTEGISSEKVPKCAALAGVLAISSVSVGDVSAFVGLGEETIQKLNTLSQVLLPTLAGAAMVSGAVTSAAAKYAAAALFISVLINLADSVIMPVIYAYIAAVIASAALGGGMLDGLAAFLKWAAVTLLTVLVLAFVAYLSISGIIAVSADAVAVRVTKTAISTVLPVVGGIISDAAGAVVSGVGVLKNAVGLFGVLAVLAVMTVPFLNLGVHYLTYKAAAKLTAVITDSRVSKLSDGIASAFGIVMGLTGACAIMVFFSVLSILKVVGM